MLNISDQRETDMVARYETEALSVTFYDSIVTHTDSILRTRGNC